MGKPTTVTVSDPDSVTTKSVDKSGRLYLGKEYAGESVRLVIERIEETDESEADESAFARRLSRKSIATRYGDDYFGTHPDWDDDLPDLGETPNMAYAQGAVVLVENPYADGRRPVLVVSNADRPSHGKQYTVAIISTTDRSEAVQLDADDLTEGYIDVYPSFVNPWSVHEFEHTEINRRVAQVSPDVVRAVADEICRYVEQTD